MVILRKIKLRVYCHFSVIHERKIVGDSLSFFMPGYQYSDKFNEGYWDGKLKYFHRRDNTFPVGLLSYVVKGLEKDGLQYKLIGFQDRNIEEIQFSSLFLQKERDYQRNCIKAYLKQGYGIIIVPTRGGKTYLAGEIIRLLKRQDFGKIVFITDISDAFKQAIDDISTVLEIPSEDIGQIQGGKIDIKDITVAMVQTLQSIVKVNNRKIHKERYEAIKKLIKETGLLIVDEVHEYGESRPRMNLIEMFDCDRLGLSATPFKGSKIQKLNIKKLVGDTVYEIKERELVDRKVLAVNRILLLFIEHQREDGGYRETVNNLVINNQARNKVILNIIRICEDLNLKLLVVFNSIKHGLRISRQSGVEFISGIDTGETRLLQKEKFLLGKGGSLLVSHIWKKGITLPEVEVLLNASGGKEQSLVIQIRGRSLGISEDKKKALYIDFVDFDEHYLSEHSYQRIRAYEKKLNKENITILNVEDEDFWDETNKFMKEFFEIYEERGL